MNNLINLLPLIEPFKLKLYIKETQEILLDAYASLVDNFKPNSVH
jgi:hypothetical protein